MMLNGMKHICVGLLVALLSGTALAQSVPSGFSVVTDAVLVPSETVLGDDVGHSWANIALSNKVTPAP